MRKKLTAQVGTKKIIFGMLIAAVIIVYGVLFLKNSHTTRIASVVPTVVPEDLPNKSYSSDSLSFVYPGKFFFVLLTDHSLAFFDRQEKSEACAQANTNTQEDKSKCSWIFRMKELVKLTQAEYNEIVTTRSKQNVYTPITMEDKNKHRWETFQLYGELYTYDALVKDQDSYYLVSFESHANMRPIFDEMIASFSFKSN